MASARGNKLGAYDKLLKERGAVDGLEGEIEGIVGAGLACEEGEEGEDREGWGHGREGREGRGRHGETIVLLDGDDDDDDDDDDDEDNDHRRRRKKPPQDANHPNPNPNRHNPNPHSQAAKGPLPKPPKAPQAAACASGDVSRRWWLSFLEDMLGSKRQWEAFRDKLEKTFSGTGRNDFGEGADRPDRLKVWALRFVLI